jgi:hypothetical protein
MWTCSQFVDWLATLDLDALAPLACHPEGDKSVFADEAAAAQKEGACPDVSGCCQGSSSRGSQSSGGCLAEHHERSCRDDSTTESGPSSTSQSNSHGIHGGSEHKPTSMRQTTLPCTRRTRQAERVWANIQRRMKQEVLYTLVSAADTIDRRPRSFELFGCPLLFTPPMQSVNVCLQWFEHKV